MATVLDALARYVVHMLAEVATDEVRRMVGVSSEIDKMGDKLLDLKNFLADADRRNITDESVREWVGQLKRAMYEATDILDLCQLKAMEHGPSTAHGGCFNPLLFCMRNPVHAREIGTRIKTLNKRLDTIKERSTVFNFINLRTYEDCHSSRVHASHHDNPGRETIGDFDRSGVVGEKIEDDTRALVDQIMKAREEVNGNNMVVAIVGVGGIGKTTLAQKVFNHETIQEEFSKKLWLSVNQNFNEVELLRRAIIEAGDVPPHGSVMNALHKTIMETLSGHKTLLVMDDVWDHRAWEGVMKIPLVNAAASGSRVLITTRDEGVARGMRAPFPYHHIDTLASDDAWSLLKKQVLSGEIEEDQINMLKDIGLKIVKKCGGLPLAIKVMGGLLRERGRLRREWEQVLDDSKWSTSKMPQELSYALYLSYEDMPPYMKQCFLYYSLLPKNRTFNVHQVTAMWISEGFIHENSNDLEEAGRTCYNGLVSRNLIEPNKFFNELNLSVCSMHDVVRSFAHYMTRDEALIAHNAEVSILSKLNTKKLIRLSIETNLLQSDELDWKSLKEQRSARTLISTIQIKMNHIDLLVTFSSLRTLHIAYADVDALVERLHKLKHLRYLALLNSDISVLPVSIGKMKLLQFLDLNGCKNLVNLPDSIVQLGQLRVLGLASVSKIPRGFHGLTSLRVLMSFRAHMDGDRCSLDELGPLSQLRFLNLIQLECVPAATHAANAKLGEKMHLINLALTCTSRLGDDGLIKEKDGVSKEEQQGIEKVFDELCPPPCVENIHISGYFGQQHSSWMMSTSMAPLGNLKSIRLFDLACCTQLPSGLCRLPCLQFLGVHRAPCIRHVGTGFLQAVATPFPRLKEMCLEGMVEWEEWEWEDQVQAMHCLEKLFLKNCKVRCAPLGLASNARALKILSIQNVQHLSYLENFPSVVELIMIRCPDMDRITNLPNLQKLTISNCPKLKVLESIPALDKLALQDYAMEKLPDFMRGITPRHLQLDCRLWLLASVATGQSGLEWDKFSHVEHVKAYTRDGKWYVLYTRRDNCKLDSNINRSIVLEETLSSCMVGAQGFNYVYKMRRSTFCYICSLVRIPFLEDMMVRDHIFVDGRVLSLQDRVAVALRVLSSGEPPEMVGSSIGVDESTVSLVTQRFVEAMGERAVRHSCWPGCARMEKIKRKFDNIHGLPNCCGVAHTVHFKFGSKDRDHEKDRVLMQAVIDPNMRFTYSWLCSSGSDTTLHTSRLFKECEKGTWLNGTKLDLSDGSGVGEYIIGDAGYPLLPWLLTPYQLENELTLFDPKVEFNWRHSAATSATLKALARLKDTWKFLQGQGWHPNTERDLCLSIHMCRVLHNIVIDKEKVRMPRYPKVNHKHVRQIPDEDVVRVRDALSQHMIKSGGNLSSSLVEAQITKVGRRAFTYICRLVRDHTFVEGRVLSVQYRVAIALRMLTSGEPLVTVGSSLCVNESTVLLVTQRFIEAMCKRALHHLRWPSSTRMGKIKRKFNKIHSLPNCCGVLNTAHVTFGSQNGHHDDNIQMQVVVDPDMKFTAFWMARSASINQSSILHGSWLFKECEKGVRLNGSKLKLSDVGEYVIGDARCPLRPWLLTPYQLESDLSDYEKEFNRRHSAATAVAQSVVARLKDTWKCLQGEGWQPNNQLEMYRTIHTCCLLHNIVIDMEEEEEEEEGAGKPSGQQESYSKPVRQLADEDAVRVRDALSQHLMESGVHTMAAEERQQEVAAAASGLVDEKEEQEALRRKRADRGKQKVHDC